MGMSVTELTVLELVQKPETHQLFRDLIEEQTRDLARYERIKYFTLLGHEFTHENSELTLTLKMKRRVIDEHYKQAIDRMYRETEGVNPDEGRDRIFFVL